MWCCNVQERAICTLSLVSILRCPIFIMKRIAKTLKGKFSSRKGTDSPNLSSPVPGSVPPAAVGAATSVPAGTPSHVPVAVSSTTAPAADLATSPLVRPSNVSLFTKDSRAASHAQVAACSAPAAAPSAPSSRCSQKETNEKWSRYPRARLYTSEEDARCKDKDSKHVVVAIATRLRWLPENGSPSSRSTN